MPNSSDSAQPAFLELVVPNKIFEISRFESAHIEHNCSIAALTDPVTIGYIYDSDRIVSVLTDPDIIKYQDKLLQEAVKGISDKTVDIDHIQIGLKLTEQDYDVLMDKKTGLTNVKTKNRMARLRVPRKGLGAVNRGFKKSDRRPFFSHKYRMFMDADPYRYIDVFIADPRHPRNQRKLAYNCLIECIPTRLTPQHISLMLFHIKSALKPGRYDQLVEHGLLLRIDTGYIMHGVSQLFAFTMRNSNQVTVGSCIPDDGRAVETTYIGDRDYKHVIGYDKLLKENKLFIETVFGRQRIDFERIADQIDGLEQWFPNQAASLRIESRELFKKPLLLRKMSKSSTLLADVSFIRPAALVNVAPSDLKYMLQDKTIENVRALRGELARVPKYTLDKYLLQFDREQVHEAFTPIVNLLKQKILHPSNRLPKPFPVNYSAQVIAARQLVKPLIEKLRSKHDSPNKIVRSAKSAIYVEGCPGSGKTKLIVKRVEHLLNSGIEAENICVLAFTREASKEFEARLSEKGLLRPEMFVGTFSSWCNKKLLKRQGGKVLNQEQCVEAIKKLLPKKDNWTRKFDAEDLAQIVFNILSYAANFDQPDYSKCIDKMAPQLGDLKKEVISIISDFTEWKEERARVDFNDLLVDARKRLTKKSKAAKTANRFSHIILDEVQDTNSVQWSILELLHKAGSHLFCVGDPAQSMYGFRGANDKKLSKFTKFFRDAVVFQLIKNYRSTPEIVMLANHLRSKINRNYSQSKAQCASGPLPRYRQERDLKSAVEWVIEDIKANQLANPAASCLILCRYKVHKKSVENALATASSQLENVGVEAMTYHASKGLEAENCYVIDPLFSNFRLGTKKEELCNTYVAFTRAKKRLTIVASERGSALYGTCDKEKAGTSIFAKLCEDFENDDGVLELVFDINSESIDN